MSEKAEGLAALLLFSGIVILGLSAGWFFETLVAALGRS